MAQVSEDGTWAMTLLHFSMPLGLLAIPWLCFREMAKKYALTH